MKPHRHDVFTCEDAARERGVRLSQIVKCMIGRDPYGQLYVMLIPGGRRLKFKRTRQEAGSIRIDLVPPDENARILDLTVGTISPIQLLGNAVFYTDESVFLEDQVDISSGRPDAGVELAEFDLRRLLIAKRCRIVSKTDE